MKKVTAITIFDTAVGTRASIVYSEINDDGVIVKDNIRLDLQADHGDCRSGRGGNHAF